MSVKDSVQSKLGKRVKVKASMGRNRTREYEAVVCGVYNNVFSLAVKSGALEKTITYSYSDVLIKNVVLKEMVG